MAVARIHGKVKCKEKRRRAPSTKHGISGDGLFVSFFSLSKPIFNICFSKVVHV